MTTNTLDTKTNLEQHHQAIRKISLKALLTNPNRFDQCHLEHQGLSVDFSRNHITPETLAHLVEHAKSFDMQNRIQALLSGQKVNSTENRPALHSAVRARPFTDITIDGTSIGPLLQVEYQKLKACVTRLRAGQWLGHTGKAIIDFVHLGIGGSDLGPRMVHQALSEYHSDQIHCHFVANVDAHQWHSLVNQLNPETTLICVASKSFTTQETKLNAELARNWLLENGIQSADLALHQIAITSAPDKAIDFGISPENVFALFDWVGGRYSLWSSIGLPIAVALGMDVFDELLKGAAAMDKHFGSASLEQNIPVVLGLIGWWYNAFWQTESQAVLPYHHHLRLLPAYLQQLIMESNGKQVQLDGTPVAAHTSPVIWGDEETNGQHAFHQLLHQGTRLIPVDFILCAQAAHPYAHSQDVLVANALAQATALAYGTENDAILTELKRKGLNDLDTQALLAHKRIPGNRPSTLLLLDRLSPFNLGQLIALYEHKTYVQSVLWNINAFDQWGVELGKTLTNPLLEALRGDAPSSSIDPHTLQLVKWYGQNSG